MVCIQILDLQLKLKTENFELDRENKYIQTN